MKLNHVKGKKLKKILLYALSTCIWCKKTKKLLQEIGAEYDFIDVDLLNEEDQEVIRLDLEKFNPAFSFPTMVIDDKECVLGYEPEEIKEKLGV